MMSEKNKKKSEGIDSRNRGYFITINNPESSGDDHVAIKSKLIHKFKNFVYACMSDEMGSTYHTHIYVHFNERVRFSTVKNQFPTAHIEGAKGTVSNCVDYITKTGNWENSEKAETRIEGTFEEIGVRPPDSKGKRKDMTELYQMINAGMKNSEIISVNQDYIKDIDKLDKVRTTLLKDQFSEQVRDVHVTYIFGDTGTGKTSGVLKRHGMSNVYRVTDYVHPFDSYSCQDIICFDEFYSNIKIGDMLNYCDIYPLELSARYVNKFACFTHVYIISNWPLEMQYKYEQLNSPNTWKAFLRRIDEVVEYKAINKIVTYPSVQAYLNRNKAFATLPSVPVFFQK